MNAELLKKLQDVLDEMQRLREMSLAHIETFKEIMNIEFRHDYHVKENSEYNKGYDDALSAVHDAIYKLFPPDSSGELNKILAFKPDDAPVNLDDLPF